MRLQGPILNARRDGHFGFVPKHLVRLADGSGGIPPVASDVFIHIGECTGIKKVTDNMVVSFELAPAKKDPSKIRGVNVEQVQVGQ